QLVRCVLRTRLYDSITCFDVMQQEVTVWMNDLVTQAGGHDIRSAVDHCSGRGGGDRSNMAGAAADAGEQLLSRAGGGGIRKDCIARWHLRAADELRKMIDVGEPEIV